MAIFFLHPLIHFLFFLTASLAEALPTPYLSPSTFHGNYHRMLENFKIFIYDGPAGNVTFPASSPAFAIFHASLLRSPFLTADPNEAHLFYLSFPAQSPRSIARSIRAIRSELPFWNRTLGADHFYLSQDGIGIESDRNLVELKKNSVQISPFPTIPGRFIPHKDLTLPPPSQLQDLQIHTEKPSFRFLAFYAGVVNPEISTLLDEFRGDPEFLIESRPLDLVERAKRMAASKFCLFFYGAPDLAVGEALGSGCVPVVISDRPILDLPFGDVLRWSELAVFVGLKGGAGEVRRAIDRTCGERYVRMREMSAKARVHFKWGPASPQQFDAFYSVLYQLWLRRHTIRYARRDSGSATSDG